MSKTYKINEIFYSLQGEGYYSGTPAIFVRFAGCNLRCEFCDTDFNKYTEQTADDIINAIRLKIPTIADYKQESHHGSFLPLLILTGGEPTLQADSELIERLHAEGFYVAIETNGTHCVPDGIDWVTCSPKYICKDDVYSPSPLVLNKADEVKIVYTGQDVEQWRHQIAATHYFLQPCSMKNTQQVVAYIKSHPYWRLSLQTHKLIGIE